MTGALAAEWRKLRTLAGPGWLLIGLAVLTAGLSAVVAAAVHFQQGGGQDPTALSLSGVDLGQAVAAVLGVTVVSGEYGSGMMRLSLAAVPRRWRLLAAKAATVAGITLVAGALGVAGSWLAGRLLLAGNGFTAGHGAALLPFTEGTALRAELGSILYLTLVALLGLGLATAIRDTAASVGVVLGLLFVVPVVASLVHDVTWHRLLQQVAPMTAGLDVQATTRLGGLPLSPWAGLGVAAAWAGGALLLGGLRLELTDA